MKLITHQNLDLITQNIACGRKFVLPKSNFVKVLSHFGPARLNVPQNLLTLLGSGLIAVQNIDQGEELLPDHPSN